MICEICALHGKTGCTENLRKLESVPDKNGIVILGITCDDCVEIPADADMSTSDGICVLGGTVQECKDKCRDCEAFLDYLIETSKVKKLCMK